MLFKNRGPPNSMPIAVGLTRGVEGRQTKRNRETAVRGVAAAEKEGARNRGARAARRTVGVGERRSGRGQRGATSAQQESCPPGAILLSFGTVRAQRLRGSVAVLVVLVVLVRPHVGGAVFFRSVVLFGRPVRVQRPGKDRGGRQRGRGHQRDRTEERRRRFSSPAAATVAAAAAAAALLSTGTRDTPCDFLLRRLRSVPCTQCWKGRLKQRHGDFTSPWKTGPSRPPPV